MVTMDKRFRRALLIVSALLFAIVGPLIVLYAVGYRFISHTQQPVPVGVVIINTTPGGASVYVNGNLIGKAPQAVSGLADGFARIRLEKQGYQPWEKVIPVAAARATDVSGIKLFAQKSDSTSIAPEISHFFIAPNRRLLAAVDAAGQLHLLNEQGQALRPPLAFSRPMQAVAWSPDSATVLVQAGGYSLISTDGAVTQRDVSGLASLKSLVWDPRLPGRILGLRSSGEVISYSTSTKAIQTLAKNIRLFTPTSRQVIAIAGTNEVIWYSLQGEIQRRQVVTGVEFIDGIEATANGYVAVHDRTGKIAVLDRSSNRVEVASHADLVGWSPDGSLLLVQPGPSELAVFNMSNDQLQDMPQHQLHSILRLSRPIHAPEWFAGGTHVVFQADDEIIISEVDTRGQALQFTVDSTNVGDAQAAVGEDGLSLFYLKSSNNRTSLVNRPLVLPEDK